jgi:integrase
MSIFKRGNVYWFHFLHEGRHIHESTGQGNPRIARQIEATFKTALVKGEVGITERKKVPTFKAAMADFLEWSAQEHRAHPATHRRYQVSSAALLRHFKDTSLDKITPEDVERFKTIRSTEYKAARAGVKRKQTAKRLRPATVNRELACLKAMFNHAVKSDLPLRNPVSRVNFLKEQNEQTRVLSYEEQQRYLAVARPLLYDIASLMLETGMRPEEAYRIRLENVRLADNSLFNPYGKTKAARRQIALTAVARGILERRVINAGVYLFPCETDSGATYSKDQQCPRPCD